MGRFDTVRRKVVDLRAATARSHRTGQYPLAKALAGDQERLSGDHRSCRPECSGVVSAGIGVGLNNRDAIDCRPQFGGRDLLVNRSGSVAELSGADVHDVPTVGLECGRWCRRSDHAAGSSRSWQLPCPDRSANATLPVQPLRVRSTVHCRRGRCTGPVRSCRIRDHRLRTCQSTKSSPGTTTLRRRNSKGSMPRRFAS